ncbi:MAG TPA: alpha/beta hydrolase [Caulobacteraceae bacterium]|nr:alpha/beta hydrolase [Caulobacteraceae bacterium]
MSLLAALAAAMAMAGAAPPELMTWADLMSRPKPAPSERVRYGPGLRQFADLWLPAGKGPFPVVLMVHGGCWQSKIADLGIMDWIAGDLAARGIAVWNIEYRGGDEAGGGYPGTFRDVAAGADALRAVAPGRLNIDHIVAFGHSAGGHLALWLAARPRLPRASPLFSPDPLPIAAVVSAGGLPDLEADRAAKDTACGPGAVDSLVGAPGARPDVYADTSPARLLPLGVRQAIVNSQLDPIAPPWLGQDWAGKVRAAGDPVEVRVIPRSGHAELIAPGTAAWAAEVKIIEALLSR